MPKLSVIIPVHNAANTVAQALESVLEQSLADIEVICVDDGSTDGSFDILRSYEALDQRVRVVAMPHQNAGPARNAGLDIASGIYVHFLDADDRVLPYGYEVLCNKMDRYRLDALRCATLDWDAERHCYVDAPADTLSRLRPGDFERLVGLEEGSPLFKASVTPWAGLYRREFLEHHHIRFNDLVCANDRSFYVAVISCAERIMVVRDRLVVYTKNQGGSLVDTRAQNFDCDARSIEIIYRRLECDGVSLKQQERVLSREFDNLFIWLGRYLDGSECEGAVREYFDGFVSRYEGPFASRLAEGYRDVLARAACGSGHGGGGRRQLKEVAPLHDACAAPKVSVVVPVGAVMEHLSETLHSLTTQRMRDIEFICVDCGGSGESLAIVRAYAAVDQRFKALKSSADSHGASLDAAMDAARGSYLAILEPGDCVPPEAYAKMYDVAQCNRAEIVQGSCQRFFVNGDGSLVQRTVPAFERSLCDRVLRPLDEPSVLGAGVPVGGGLYRLDFLRRWGICFDVGLERAIDPDTSLGRAFHADAFWFQVASRAERVLFLSGICYLRRCAAPGLGEPVAKAVDDSALAVLAAGYDRIGGLFSEDFERAEDAQCFLTALKFKRCSEALRWALPEQQEACRRWLRDEFMEPFERGLVAPTFMDETARLQLRELFVAEYAGGGQVDVSVILPVLNATRTLDDALDGLLAQGGVRLELICIDLGSVDGSLELLRSYAARDLRVRVLSRPGMGLGVARNAGMDLAGGEYVAFLEADKLYDADMLRVAMARARSCEADVVAFQTGRYDEQFGVYKDLACGINRALLPACEPFAGADVPVDAFGLMSTRVWDKLFRADFLCRSGLRFSEGANAGNLLFVSSCVARAQRIATLDRQLACDRAGLADGLPRLCDANAVDCCDELLALRGRLRAWDVYTRFEQDFINFSLRTVLDALGGLSGEPYRAFYGELAAGGLAELGLLGRRMDYFYDREDYETLVQLTRLDGSSFALWRYQRERERRAEVERQFAESGAKLRKLRAKNARLRERNMGLRVKYSSLRERFAALRNKNAHLRERNDRLRERNERLHECNDRLRERNERLHECNDCLRERNKKLSGEFERIKGSQAYRFACRLNAIACRFRR